MKHDHQALKREPPQVPAVQATTTLIAILMLSFFLTGCPSLPTDLVAAGSVDVERVSSPKARIKGVFVGDKDGVLLVRGRLEKRHAGRSPIPGHLHIEALGPDGTMLGQVTCKYRRLSPKTGTSEFSQILEIHPGQVRTVRVIHHHRNGDEDAATASPQRGASCGAHGSLRPVRGPSRLRDTLRIEPACAEVLAGEKGA